MKIVFMGSPEFAVPALNALVNADHTVCAVYCQPPRPAGRGKKVRLTPVHARAQKLGLPVRCPPHFREAADKEDFANLGADIAVVVAYGLILPPRMLSAPKHGCLNIHASLLPRWRGAAPIHRAIMAGDTITGVCIMKMMAGLDTGPVLARLETQIEPQETTGGLHNRLSLLGAKAIVNVLADLAGFPLITQPEKDVCYAKKISKAETRIDWTLPAIKVDQMIRGLSPFPGAWCMIGSERIKLLEATPENGAGAPGAVIDGTMIACGQDAIRLQTLQPEGKKPMSCAAFLQGHPIPEKVS